MPLLLVLVPVPVQHGRSPTANTRPRTGGGSQLATPLMTATALQSPGVAAEDPLWSVPMRRCQHTTKRDDNSTRRPACLCDPHAMAVQPLSQMHSAGKG